MSARRAVLLSLLAALACAAVWALGRGPTVVTFGEDDLVTIDGGGDEASEQAPDGLRTAIGRPQPGDRLAAPATGDQPDSLVVTLRGRVIAAVDGRAVAGADVALERGLPSEGGGRERLRRPIRTDGAGRFAVRGPLRARHVTLVVRHPLWAPAVFDATLPSLSEVDYDVGDIALQRGGTVSGSVEDARGAPLPEAEVTLQPDRGNRLMWATEVMAELRRTSDAAGGFRYDRVPPGSFRLVVRAALHTEEASGSFVLEEGEHQQLPPIRLRDAVRLEGEVVDARGEPVEGARVTVRSSAPAGTASPAAWRAVTAGDGGFAVDHLPQAPASVHVAASGHLSWAQEQVDPARHLRVTLPDGLRIAGVVVDARTGARLEAYAIALRRLGGTRTPGTGSGPSGAVPGVRVQPKPVDWMDTRRLPADPGAVEPHPGGRFAFPGLDAGIYAVDVKADGYARTRSEPVELGSGGAELTVAVAPGLRVAGTAVAARGGAAVAGCRVDLLVRPEQDDPTEGRPGFAPRAGLPWQSVISAADGSFAFADVPAGRYVLVGAAHGHGRAQTEPFPLTADRVDLRLMLPALAELFGTVRGSDGEGGDQVIAFADFRHVASRPVEPDGSYRIDGLEPGRYWVRAFRGQVRDAMRGLMRQTSQPEGERPPHDVELAPGDRTRLDLELVVPATATVRGTVQRNGGPVSGYAVMLEPDREAEFEASIQRGWLEPDGSFTIADVPLGDYLLRLLRPGRERNQLHVQPVAVREADRDVVVDVHLLTATLDGEVLDPDGGAQDDIEGTVRMLLGASRWPADAAEERAIRTAITLPVVRGRFRSDDVIAGTYLLQLRVTGRQPVERQLAVAGGQDARVVLTAGPRR